MEPLSVFSLHLMVIQSSFQLVEGQGILAYHAPLAPSSGKCICCSHINKSQSSLKVTSYTTFAAMMFIGLYEAKLLNAVILREYAFAKHWWFKQSLKWMALLDVPLEDTFLKRLWDKEVMQWTVIGSSGIVALVQIKLYEFTASVRED